MAAAYIWDRETLEAWLNTQPREVAVAIAARAALRVLPLFSRFAERAQSSRQFADLTSALFRATALARMAAVNPTRANKFRATIAATIGMGGAARAAHAAAKAAYATAFAAYATDAIAYAADAVADAGAADAADADAATWRSIRIDAGTAEQGGPAALISMRLWPGEPPDWAQSAWATMQSVLPANENWEVWTRWYANRLNGRDDPEPFEFAYVTAPDEVWRLGSAKANTWIRAELDRLKASFTRTEPNPTAPQAGALAAPAAISDAMTLTAWLLRQPREARILIAARAALRILPLASKYRSFTTDRGLSVKHFTDLVIALFRAIAVARAVAKYPARVAELHRAAMSADEAGWKFNAIEIANSARAATRAAYTPNEAQATGSASDAALISAYCVAYPARFFDLPVANKTANAATLSYVRDDAAIVDREGFPGLVAAPLWRGQQPDWVNDAWSAIHSALPRNENWEVWTAWYEDRLNGANYDEPFELAYANVRENIWAQGPAITNAWIRAELDRLKALLTQTEPEPTAPEAEAPAEPMAETPPPSPRPAPPIAPPTPPQGPTPPALCVLFSYAWQPIEAQHRAQLDLYARLTHLINQKPPDFASLPKIELWRDAERLENSHGAEAQIAAACDRAFLLLVLISRKYPTSEGCMQEFDKFVDAKGDNLPGRQAIVVAVNCRRNEVEARFSRGLRLWMLDDEENTLVKAIARKEPAKDAFAHRIAEQIWRAAARHLGDDLTDASPKMSAPKSKTVGRRKGHARERLQSFTYVPAWNELRVNESGRIGANPDAPHVNDASASAEKERESQEEVCRKLAEALADGLELGVFANFRDDYLVSRLHKYADCVPTHNNRGNMVLANVWAGYIREHLNDHRDKWPKRCVKEAENVIAQHDKLKPAFPAAEAATAFAADAQSLPPVHEASLADIPQAINEKPASDAFVPEVAEALSQSLGPIASPELAKLQSEPQRGPREYEIVTTLNRLVRVLDIGAKRTQRSVSHGKSSCR